MWGVLKRNPYAVISALLLHLAILFFLIFGVDWAKPDKPVTPKVNVVQAHTVEADKLPPTAAEKQRAEEQKRLQREAELQRQKQEKRKQEQRLAEQKALKEKQAAEAKRKAEADAKKKAEAKRQAEVEAKRKAQAEAKRKAEVEAKRKADAEAKRQAEAEAKRKAEAEAKRRAEDERRRAEAAAQAERERALQAQIAAEQNSREIDRYVAVIKQQIERSWLKPAASTEGLSCVVQVRLIPGGDVIPGGVSIISSSGNDAFDRSVETAVYKSAPLPVPSGALFESFRTLKLNFKPNK
ncbi:MAG: cell envelope integrity protein TolA [Candidatus Thiodiazotropha sp.]